MFVALLTCPENMDETVLINGSNGTAGRMAIQIARHLGAKKVIVTGRNPSILKHLCSLGADVVVPLDGDGNVVAEELKEQMAAGIDVVLDFFGEQRHAGARFGRSR